jgi:arylsulfatase A-like enzyme
MSRPNILLIMTDQHKADHVGFAGNAEIRTPNLDALAAESVVFERAYVANPICMPNRASLFTGVMPSIHGTLYNGIPLNWSANTFARVLRADGYRTGYFGKCHLQTLGASPARVAQWQDPQSVNDGYLDPHSHADYEWENRERHRQGWVDVPLDYYGFDTCRFIIDHADFCSGHYYQWLLAQGVDPREIQGPEAARPYSGQNNQLWRTAVPPELYPSTYVANETLDFLNDSSESPWFAVCSFADPHHPFTPPGPYFDAFDPASLSLPATFEDPHSRSMPQFRRIISQRGLIPRGVRVFAPTADQYRDLLAKAYGMLSLVDDCVGRVLAAIDANTVVVFTSDHGDSFGDHGLMLKHGIHYDGNIRVPMLVRAPEIQPARCRSLVSTLDIAPTLLDLAQCPPYFGMQGVSLLPLLMQPHGSLRDCVLIEEQQLFEQPGTDVPIGMLTLVTDGGRITHYRGSDQGDLFDHREDELELNNLWSQSGARGLRQQLSDRLIEATIEHNVSRTRAEYTA